MNAMVYAKNKNRRAENVCSQFFLWCFHAADSKHWARYQAAWTRMSYKHYFKYCVGPSLAPVQRWHRYYKVFLIVARSPDTCRFENVTNIVDYLQAVNSEYV